MRWQSDSARLIYSALVGDLNQLDAALARMDAAQSGWTPEALLELGAAGFDGDEQMSRAATIAWYGDEQLGQERIHLLLRRAAADALHAHLVELGQEHATVLHALQDLERAQYLELADAIEALGSLRSSMQRGRRAQWLYSELLTMASAVRRVPGARVHSAAGRVGRGCAGWDGGEVGQ